MSPPIYLDTNATTQPDPRVCALMTELWGAGLGNASASHGHGRHAAWWVSRSEDTLVEVTGAKHCEVTWTSGATEANNTLIAALSQNARHLVVSTIEHASVLRPLDVFATARGVEVTKVDCGSDGIVRVGAILDALRPETDGVLLMAANNVTGALQPIQGLCAVLPKHVWLHVDAAQTLGKGGFPLPERVDSLSLSAHKLHGPPGIGALLTRPGAQLPALLHGGAHQGGRRAGTLPVALIAGFAEAASLASQEAVQRADACLALRATLLDWLSSLGAQVLTPLENALPNTLCARFPGLDARLVQTVLAPWASIGLGSACASGSPEPSHVLEAMGMSACAMAEAVRLSWSFDTPRPALPDMAKALYNAHHQSAKSTTDVSGRV